MKRLWSAWVELLSHREEVAAKVRAQKAEGWDLLKVQEGLSLPAYEAMAKTAMPTTPMSCPGRRPRSAHACSASSTLESGGHDDRSSSRQ